MALREDVEVDSRASSCLIGDLHLLIHWCSFSVDDRGAWAGIETVHSPCFVDARAEIHSVVT